MDSRRQLAAKRHRHAGVGRRGQRPAASGELAASKCSARADDEGDKRRQQSFHSISVTGVEPAEAMKLTASEGA